MPDDPTASSASPDPSSAPPGGDPSGAVQSGGAGPDQQAGGLPPTGGPGALDQSVPQQGQEALGREVGRKIVGLMHFARGMFSPFSEEAKSLDSAIRGMIKHFKPDAEAAKTGQSQAPQMSPGQIADGGPPQMSQQQGQPQPPTGPIPRLSGGMQTG